MNYKIVTSGKSKKVTLSYLSRNLNPSSEVYELSDKEVYLGVISHQTLVLFATEFADYALQNYAKKDLPEAETCIRLARKWLEDQESVSNEELRAVAANTDAVYAVYAVPTYASPLPPSKIDYVTKAAYAAAAAAYAAAKAADDGFYAGFCAATVSNAAANAAIHACYAATASNAAAIRAAYTVFDAYAISAISAILSFLSLPVFILFFIYADPASAYYYSATYSNIFCCCFCFIVAAAYSEPDRRAAKQATNDGSLRSIDKRPGYGAAADAGKQEEFERQGEFILDFLKSGKHLFLV